MFKNRTAQLIFQSFFCAIGLIAIVASIGVFEDAYNLRGDFYVHFTNLSNYLCIGIVFAELIQTAKKNEDSFVKVAPFLISSNLAFSLLSRLLWVSDGLRSLTIS